MTDSQITRAMTPPQSVRVYLVTRDENVVRLIKDIVAKQNISVSIRELQDTEACQDEQLRPSDVILLDAVEGMDAKSLVNGRGGNSFRHAHKLVMCSVTDASYWQDLVLKETIDDYFVVRPSFDPSYLKVQIWRALRLAAGRDSRRYGIESVEDTTQIEPKKTATYHGKTALVVDNDLPSMRLLRDVLGLTGFSVLTANTVVRAAVAHRNRDFDIVFIDVMLPGVSGPHAIKALKQGLQITAPIVVISAHAERKLIEECRKMGIADFHVKPIRREEIEQRVARALAS